MKCRIVMKCGDSDKIIKINAHVVAIKCRVAVHDHEMFE